MKILLARVAPDLLKVPKILSDKAVNRSVVDTKDLKPCWGSEKRVLTRLLFTGS